MQHLLDLYRLTGHLTPGIEKAILQIAGSSILPEQADRYSHAHDELIDAFQALHGIIFGSGRAPVGPAVDFDSSVSRQPAGSRSAHSRRRAPLEPLATPYASVAGDLGPQKPYVLTSRYPRSRHRGLRDPKCLTGASGGYLRNTRNSYPNSDRRVYLQMRQSQTVRVVVTVG